MMSISKPLVTDPTVEVSKELDIIKMIEVMADESIRDVDDSYYTGGGLIESVANKALRRIQGRMMALKALVQSVK